MAIVGVATGTAVGLTLDITYSFAAGWAAASAVYLVWIWILIGGMDSEQTRDHATREDPGRATSDLLVLGATVASLGAVALIIGRARSLHGGAQTGVAALAVVSVALSWLLIHTLYCLRYARVYFSEPIGGIDFNSPDEPPRYVDFAYVSFDLGQTFQISDTDLQTTELRAIVLRHTLLSYVFNTVILAATINLVSSLG